MSLDDDDIRQQIEGLCGSYGHLQQALVQLLMTVKSIEEQDLLKFLEIAVQRLIFKAPNHTEATPTSQRTVADSDNDDHTEDERSASSSTDRQEERELGLKIHEILTADDLLALIGMINRKLSALDMGIEKVVDDEPENSDGRESYTFVLVNKKSTKVLQVATSFTEKETKIIVYLLDTMFGDGDEVVTDRHTYSIPRYDALNGIRSKFGNSMVEAEGFLKRLVLDNWLEMDDSRYGLTKRAIVELKPYLEANYDSALPCKGCGQIVTRGLACKEPKCPIRYHRGCYKLTLSAIKDKKCPNSGCNGTLDEMVPIN